MFALPVAVDVAWTGAEAPAGPVGVEELLIDAVMLWLCPESVDVALWLWLTTTASAEPPVAATAYVDPAPTTNLFLKSGVPLEPLHNSQPLGIEAILPDHITIAPEGTPFVSTKAVVAIWVVLVPGAAVVAKGVPVNVGETEEIAPENVAVEPDKAPVKAVVPVTAKLPLTVKLLTEPVKLE